MDRTQAAAEQLRAAHDVAGAVERMRPPHLADWVGPAAAAAAHRLGELDTSLGALRDAAHDWLGAARSAGHG